MFRKIKIMLSLTLIFIMMVSQMMVSAAEKKDDYVKFNKTYKVKEKGAVEVLENVRFELKKNELVKISCKGQKGKDVTFIVVPHRTSVVEVTGMNDEARYDYPAIGAKSYMTGVMRAGIYELQMAAEGSVLEYKISKVKKSKLNKEYTVDTIRGEFPEIPYRERSEGEGIVVSIGEPLENRQTVEIGETLSTSYGTSCGTSTTLGISSFGIGSSGFSESFSIKEGSSGSVSYSESTTTGHSVSKGKSLGLGAIEIGCSGFSETSSMTEGTLSSESSSNSYSVGKGFGQTEIQYTDGSLRNPYYDSNVTASYTAKFVNNRKQRVNIICETENGRDCVFEVYSLKDEKRHMAGYTLNGKTIIDEELSDNLPKGTYYVNFYTYGGKLTYTVAAGKNVEKIITGKSITKN